MKLNWETQREVWIYGSGSFALTVIASLQDLDFSIRGVIDHMNLGKKIQTSKNNFIVQSPVDVDLNRDSQIVLAVCNLHGDLREISSNLPPHVGVTSPVELFQMLSENGITSYNYWLSTDFELYVSSSSEIQKFSELLCDDSSRELLKKTLEYRQFGSIGALPTPLPLHEQYLAADLLTPPRKLRIIDLGACQGENLADFLNAGHIFIDGHLFEPDDKNLNELRNQLLALRIESLTCHPFGAWNETTTLRFRASGTAASSLSVIGDESINVVALDDFLPPGFAPNFIKMDIEGAEMEALEGMLELIANHRPHLAISVYHKPSDLWKIGNFLNSSFPGFYRYYLRVYGEQTFDTILYAVPN
jgi:FkbM family methyltransferase